MISSCFACFAVRHAQEAGGPSAYGPRQHGGGLRAAFTACGHLLGGETRAQRGSASLLLRTHMHIEPTHYDILFSHTDIHLKAIIRYRPVIAQNSIYALEQ